MSVFMGSGLVLARRRKKIKNLRSLGGAGSGILLLVSSFAILVWFFVFSFG